jgi:UDP-N-acetylglucosamine 2-epimerase (non-hydrolysing)
MDRVVLHVVGTRPNLVKAAPVMRALGDRGCDQQLVHTGQHYDHALSGSLSCDLGLAEPDVNLRVGSGSHAVQTARLLIELEKEFLRLRPSLVVVYGDVNSTLAATLTAAKLQLPVAHVEAGLRSFDPSMPEEINRRVTDSLSALLFVTSPEGLANLAREGAAVSAMHLVGNPMIDTLLASLGRLDVDALRARLNLPGTYAVATLHRPANVDDLSAARSVVRGLAEVASRLPVVIPLHPRGRQTLRRAGLEGVPGVRVMEPLGYLDFLSLVRGARLVVTDSGGLQEETTVLNVPCLTVRPSTERPITISHGTNRLVTPGELGRCALDILESRADFPRARPPLWDGEASLRIAEVVMAELQRVRPGR